MNENSSAVVYSEPPTPNVTPSLPVRCCCCCHFIFSVAKTAHQLVENPPFFILLLQI
jgi:hypothetical protein